jgi:pimeloyl-ACP methyl ester carboxylesterase
MSERTEAGKSDRKRRLMYAGAAAVAAWSLRRRWSLAYPLAALAAKQLRESFASGSSMPAPAGAAAPEQERRAVVEGIPMRWEEHGDPEGLPVIFVHGIPTQPRLWRYVIPRLAKPDTRCLAWEMVGFGWSMEAGLERDVSVASQAGYLRAWLRHLGIERALFVGHDLGGGVVQRLVVHEPQLCAGLVLTDCIAYDNWPVPPVQAMQAMSGALEQLPAALLKPIFSAGVGKLSHDNEARGRESAALHWGPYARDIGPRALAHQIRSLDARHTLEIAHRLPQLRVPARVVWAEVDPLGMASGEQLARDLRAPLRQIPGGRHFTPEDHPDLIAEAVQELLASVQVTERRHAGGEELPPPM